MTVPVETGGADAVTAPLVGVPGPRPVVLARRADCVDRDRPIPMIRIVAPIAVGAVLIAATVGIGGALVSRRIAESQAVHDVAELTDAYATSVVQPALTDAMAADSTVARRVLDPIVRNNLIGGSLIRVKLWTPQGTVRYADESRLIGQTFRLDADAVKALTAPRTSADISDLHRPENQFERSQGKLLEVYRPVWTPNGQPLLFETYFRYDVVSSRSHELWRGFSGVMLGSLAALLVLLIPLGGVLLARARRARAQREQLMRRALDASDEERRRIAASLHDGVVQHLAALSFTAAGQAGRAAIAGDAQSADQFHELAASMRESISGLRALLVDIYPPNLHTRGLSAALEDLARAVSAGGEPCRRRSTRRLRTGCRPSRRRLPSASRRRRCATPRGTPARST
jgi:signal transduction histidine kinase